MVERDTGAVGLRQELERGVNVAEHADRVRSAAGDFDDRWTPDPAGSSRMADSIEDKQLTHPNGIEADLISR